MRMHFKGLRNSDHLLRGVRMMKFKNYENSELVFSLETLDYCKSVCLTTGRSWVRAPADSYQRL